MNDLSVNPMAENDILTEYNKLCKIWEFYADGNVSAYIRNMLIKEMPKLDDLLINDMNKKKGIKNLGEHDYLGFCIKSEYFETHLYFADFTNSKTPVVASTLQPAFASSEFKNVVVASRELFSLNVTPERTGILLNYFGGLFAACFNCSKQLTNRPASMKYFYREILANIFVCSVANISAERMREYADPDHTYFTEEVHKYILEYNKKVLETMQKSKPYIPAFAPGLNDLIAIITLLQYQHKNEALNKAIKENEDEDYGDETEDKNSDSV